MSTPKNTITNKNVKDPDYYRKIILNNIKHDLTNPMNAILGYSELILDIVRNENYNALNQDIKTIYDSGNTILLHINEIFSRDNNQTDDHIGNIIHNSDLQFNLRTPLSTIIGLTEMISRELEFDLGDLSDKNIQEIKESIDKIAQAGQRLVKLLNDLKMYSDYTIDELITSYKPNLYSKDATHRLFDFNIDTKKTVEPGTILLVDDEPSNLELLDKILKPLKHTILISENAESAINILSDKSKSIDLILLDLIMPGMNGKELLQKFKLDLETSHIPIIMQSALDELDAIVECISLGADDFLMKPINQVLLKAKVNNALEKKYFHDKELKYQKKIKEEQEKSEDLLLNILPSSIAERLKEGETLIADDIENATVLFADLTGFTELSSTMKAKDLVMLLNNIFSVFDELVTKYSLEKIKTIGDSYMLAGGIPEPSKNHAESVAEMALDMLAVLPQIKTESQQSLKIRIGINSGNVSAGVIGKKKFTYDLWGDTVNVASRMEAYGKHDHIHVNDATYTILKEKYLFEKREELDIPGKGKMQTYFLIARNI